MNSALVTPNNSPTSLQQLGESLDENIAHGNASKDTVSTYSCQLKAFFNWCRSKGIDPLVANKQNIRQYRRYLVNKDLKVSTIALKLAVVRRLYATAVEEGLILVNPAQGVQPPPSKRKVGAEKNFLSKNEAKSLLAVLPKNNTVAALRERLLVALMLICGCRQIELHRLNVGDIVRREEGIGIEVEGKGSTRIIYLTTDLAELLARYLNGRKKAGDKLLKNTPVFTCLSSNYYGQRLSRRSMQRIVNKYLNLARLKHSEERTVTTHGLRHTTGFLSQLAGLSLRATQKFLGHSDPKTTAIYAHVVDDLRSPPASRLGISI